MTMDTSNGDLARIFIFALGQSGGADPGEAEFSERLTRRELSVCAKRNKSKVCELGQTVAHGFSNVNWSTKSIP